MRGFIYIVSNPSLEGLIKIGKSESDPVKRAAQLSNTSNIPTPFEVEYFAFVDDFDELETAVHLYLASYRVNKRREFFDCPVAVAIDAVQQMAGKKIILEEITAEKKREIERLRKEEKIRKQKLEAEKRKREEENRKREEEKRKKEQANIEEKKLLEKVKNEKQEKCRKMIFYSGNCFDIFLFLSQKDYFNFLIFFVSLCPTFLIFFSIFTEYLGLGSGFNLPGGILDKFYALITLISWIIPFLFGWSFPFILKTLATKRLQKYKDAIETGREPNTRFSFLSLPFFVISYGLLVISYGLLVILLSFFVALGLGF